MLLMLDVSIPDKLIDIRETQFRNILSMLVAAEVLKLDKSSDTSERQFSNMPYMLDAFDASKFAKLMDLREVQPLNIEVRDVPLDTPLSMKADVILVLYFIQGKSLEKLFLSLPNTPAVPF